MAKVMLLENAQQNGNGDAVLLDSVGKRLPYTIYVWGTFDGATATLQISPDPKTLHDSNPSAAVWVSVSSQVFTAADAKEGSFTSELVRLVVTDAGASTDISAALM